MPQDITLRPATRDDATFIARGFHMAMLYDDADELRIEQFARLVCTRQDVLYSWRNTSIAELEGEAVGMVTSYDGQHYRSMRETTMEIVRATFGTEFPGMEDEALPGEYYIDSLAVMPEHRKKGIGRQLLLHAIAQGKASGLDVTIAVDPVNLRARRLYESLGFREVGSLFIFGHDYTKMAITH